ncbi:MAG: methyltransferase [Crenarchaeota archaeon]|nr:methyltransferase [Thermoproteota archaeon]
MRAVFTTNPGLEDVCERELASWGLEVLGSSKGRVEALAGSLEELAWRLERSKSVHKAFVLLYEGPLEGLNLSGIERFVGPHETFAVRAERVGEGPPSPEIARLVGEEVVKRVKDFFGAPPAVDLDYPSVVVRAEWYFDRLRVGVEVGGEESLHRRYYRVEEHVASLKPTIAYAMLELGGALRARRLLDPMCGSGTIAIEAALGFAVPEIICSDINKKYIEKAITNSYVARVRDLIAFAVHDAGRVHELVDWADLVVTNPPFGVRMGSPRKALKLYERFFRSVRRILSGRLVLITPLEEAGELMRSSGLKVVEERSVYHGDLWVKLFVAEA